MNILAGMIVYNRMETVNLWMKAWNNAEKPQNVKLLITHNYDGITYDRDEYLNIIKWAPDYYYPRINSGQDIGAFRDVIKKREFDPWDILFWSTDDNIPVNKHFLQAFIEPFEEDDRLGLVGNHFVHSSFYAGRKYDVPDHIRTTCFAIRKEVALQLKFPIPLSTKWDCYSFEWFDKKMNMTEQVLNMQYKILPVYKDFTRSWADCNDYMWDIGSINMDNHDHRCRKDYKQIYASQFIS